jgi:hypothetical protein
MACRTLVTSLDAGDDSSGSSSQADGKRVGQFGLSRTV